MIEVEIWKIKFKRRFRIENYDSIKKPIANKSSLSGMSAEKYRLTHLKLTQYIKKYIIKTQLVLWYCFNAKLKARKTR